MRKHTLPQRGAAPPDLADRLMEQISEGLISGILSAIVTTTAAGPTNAERVVSATIESGNVRGDVQAHVTVRRCSRQTFDAAVASSRLSCPAALSMADIVFEADPALWDSASLTTLSSACDVLVQALRVQFPWLGVTHLALDARELDSMQLVSDTDC